MGRVKNKRYRSYREKKSQTKKFRTYFLRITIFILFYSLFTTFFAFSLKVDSDSMEPSIKIGSCLIVNPSKNLNSLIQKQKKQSFRRGEIVLTETNYFVNSTFLEKLLDPIVRIFTLQKKSLIYDNSSYKGRAELLRVVGIPGDTIRIKDNTVYIKPNGQEFFLSEFELTKIDYDISKKIYPESWKNEFPFSSEYSEQFINEEYYFLISDNRGVYNDSRIFGLINTNEIHGRILMKYWPINEFKLY